MIRRLRIFFLSFFLILGLVTARPAYSGSIDPRLKALGLMAAYGTVGGALLGLASLAFISNGRAIPQGASLGLYAGLLFGSYVVISHASKKYQGSQPQEVSDDYYQETSFSDLFFGEDQGTDDPYGEYGGGAGGYPEQGQGVPANERWNPYQMHYDFSIKNLNQNNLRPKQKYRPTFYINLINIQF